MASAQENNAASYSLDKSKIKFLLLEGIHEQAVELIQGHGYPEVELLRRAMTGNELVDALRGVHFLGIRSRSQVTADIVAAADRLTAIGCFCIGTNQVDLQAAARSGVPVFNAPFSNTRSVAELALAEIIMLMRGIPRRNAAAHRGEWIKSATRSHEIRGKTLGIVGYGHIGSQLGIMAESMGMNVVFYDIEHKLPLGNASSFSSQFELLRERPGSYLINASRGHVVDIDALADSLENGHIGGAAIDVFPSEPGSNQDTFVSRLRGMDNVLLTPHIGGSTLEAQENIALEVAGKLVKYSDNGTTRSAVNFPQVSLPDHENASRILHIHRNEPGVLQRINTVFSGHAVNIASQYLDTSKDIGYVVMDIETDDPLSLMRELREIPATIRARILH